MLKLSTDTNKKTIILQALQTQLQLLTRRQETSLGWLPTKLEENLNSFTKIVGVLIFKSLTTYTKYQRQPASRHMWLLEVSNTAALPLTSNLERKENQNEKHVSIS